MCQSCKAENAQAFAGQHARTSTSFYIFDEWSEVPDEVSKTALEGGLTDGEPMFFGWGQCVRSSGMLYEVNFKQRGDRWYRKRIDSRTSKFTNKALIQQLIDDYGLDSDEVKVRVLGLPPSASELQYIDRARVDLARKRTHVAMSDEPIIGGFDVSGGGKAWNVLRFRQGLNGNVLPPIRLPGEADPDRNQRVGICAELLRDRRPGHRIAALFIDAAFGAAIAVRLRALGFDNVYEVNFGGPSPDPLCLNLRAYMHKKTKDWLLHGAVPDDDKFCDQLCLSGYHLNSSGKLVIESKADIQARNESSPDDADAFMLTFALPISVAQSSAASVPPPPPSVWG